MKLLASLAFLLFFINAQVWADCTVPRYFSDFENEADVIVIDENTDWWSSDLVNRNNKKYYIKGDLEIRRNSALDNVTVFVEGTLTVRRQVTISNSNFYVKGDIGVKTVIHFVNTNLYSQSNLNYTHHEGDTNVAYDNSPYCENIALTSTPDFSQIINELENQCSAIFPDVLQSHSSGKLTIGGVAQVNPMSPILQFGSDSTHPNSCGAGIDCSTASPASQKLALVTIPNNGSTNNKVITDEETLGLGNSTIIFDSIVVRDNSELTFNARPGEVYEINNLTVRADGEVSFAPGQYAIANLVLEYNRDGGAEIEIDGGGIVYLFVENKLTIENIEIEDNEAEQLKIIVNNDFDIILNDDSDDEKIHMTVYAKGNLNISGQGRINGAFAASDIELTGQVYINYESACEEEPKVCEPRNWDIHDPTFCSGDLTAHENGVNWATYTCNGIPISSPTVAYDVTGSVFIKSGAKITGWIYSQGNMIFEGDAEVAAGLYTAGCLVNAPDDVKAICDNCGGPDDNYTFTFGGTKTPALTCEAHPVNIAVRLDGVINKPYSKEIIIKTDSGQGDWSIINATGSIDNGIIGDGKATYRFNGEGINLDNGAIVLGLHHFQVSDVKVTVENVDAISTFDLVFLDSLIQARFSCTDDKIGSNDIASTCINIANRPFDLTLTALKSVGNVCESYNPEKTLFWSTYSIPNSGSESVEVKADSWKKIGNSELDKTPISATFNDGVATLSVNYPDAGKVRIYVQDGDSPLSIDSKEILLNPYQLVLSNIRGTKRPGNTVVNNLATTNSGNGFIRASIADYNNLTVDTFDVTAKATIDCTTSTALTDNCGGSKSANTHILAQNFINYVILNTSLVFPTSASASPGMLTAKLGLEQSMLEGSLIFEQLAFSEVGTLELQAVSNDYFIEGNNIDTGEVSNVGRFYPDYLSHDTFVTIPACSVSDFTYMAQQEISTNYILRAHAQGTSVDLKNYDESLGYPVATAFEHYADAGGIDLSTRLPVSYYNPELWAAGEYVVTNELLGIDKNISPDGPFNAIDYFIKLSGQDGEKVQDGPDVDTDLCVGDKCILGKLGNLVYGRLQAGNGHGSEFQPIRTLIEATYFDGQQFVPFSRDVCTPVVNQQLSAMPIMTTSNEIAVGSGKSKLAIQNSPLITGKSYFEFSAPDSRGKLDYFIRLKGLSNANLYAPWLLDNGNAVTCPDETSSLKDCISGSVAFGLFRGNDRIIYRMQTFE